MPIELQVITASEFIRLDPRELLDFEASKQALQTLALACLKRGVEQAILDLRRMPVLSKPHFTIKELGLLVQTFRAAGFGKRERLAILYKDDAHWGIRDFAFISRMRGMHVQAFEDFEAAMQWLAEGHEVKGEHEAGEVPIPITRRKRMRPGS